MDINQFIAQLDKLFEEKRISEVETFLNRSMKQALKEADKPAQFTILNEMMGFFRDTSQYEKSIQACRDCIRLMKEMGIEGTVEYATALQNIANAHRAAGLLQESLEYYDRACDIYTKNIAPDDYRFASLNNNIALVYQEMNDFNQAAQYQQKALNIIEKIENSEIETAVSCSNLAASLLELDRVDEALEYLERALSIYRKDEVKNFHYSAALSAMAAAQCKKGNYKKAVPLYEEALKEIEINMGKGTAYQITKENLESVYQKLKIHPERKEIKDTDCKVCDKKDSAIDFSSKVQKKESKISGIQLAQDFYREYGAPMIHEKFPQYENKIAVGFVGEGSERFGFDDCYSMDHDFGPGFCMWITEDTYHLIGDKLQQEYEKLPKEYQGITRVDTKMAQGRCGVQIIGDFYEKYTGLRQSPRELEQWIELEDYRLATVTNGIVFRDDEKIFSEIRKGFFEQPEAARMVKLAREIAAMAQTGQCNYARAMARKDYVTAYICISEFMQHTMKCLFLLNRKYAPYYKWMLEGTKKLEILPEVGDILRAMADMPDQRTAWKDDCYSNTNLNEKDRKVLTIEIVARLIIHELGRQKIIKETESNFLNDYVEQIMKKADACAAKKNQNMSERDEVMEQIIKLEFEAFDKVQNQGGRADCQNDWPFFYIMRKSQYMTWNNDMLCCIRDLWQENKKKGWNMITEKYGRMMEFTAPKEYEQIQKYFPEKSEQSKAIVEQISEIQVQWMKEFARKYPKLASNARDITRDADEMDNTSYETYLKGELLTYSDALLEMYGRFIVELAREGKNLAEMTIENTVHLQGYKTLEAAEQSL